MATSSFPALWLPVFEWLLSRVEGHVERVVGGISVFDGRKRQDQSRISDAMTAGGCPCYSLDEAESRKQDVVSGDGVLCFLRMLTRMIPKSLLWLAPPCSSWTNFISRASHQRSREWVYGRNSAWTAHGNACAEFCARAILAAAARGLPGLKALVYS